MYAHSVTLLDVNVSLRLFTPGRYWNVLCVTDLYILGTGGFFLSVTVA